MTDLSVKTKNHKKHFPLRNKFLALAGVAQRTERWPENQRAAGSIPSQGTCLGCRSGPQ